jgi:hypothetical protein
MQAKFYKINDIRITLSHSVENKKQFQQKRQKTFEQLKKNKK